MLFTLTFTFYGRLYFYKLTPISLVKKYLLKKASIIFEEYIELLII